MSRHRGRSRPFARLRYTWPLHCSCWNCIWIPVIYDGAPYSLFDTHPVKTVTTR